MLYAQTEPTNYMASTLCLGGLSETPFTVRAVTARFSHHADIFTPLDVAKIGEMGEYHLLMVDFVLS